MLSDAQIERYARQIVLPEVGGRGQERLLGSCVRLAGAPEEPSRDTLILCALHLGVAGVGVLAFEADASKAVAPALAARNPDVEIAPVSRLADLTIAIGEPNAFERSPDVLGGAGAEELFVALPRTRCSGCLGAALPAFAPPRSWPAAVAPLLASLIATVTLGEILRLAENREPTLLILGLRDAGATSRAIARRSGCPDC